MVAIFALMPFISIETPLALVMPAAHRRQFGAELANHSQPQGGVAKHLEPRPRHQDKGSARLRWGIGVPKLGALPDVPRRPKKA